MICDEDSFESYYSLYFDRFVSSLCGYFDGDQSVAEDVVQEGFIRAFKRWGSCRMEYPESRVAWLKKIMVNTARNKLKSDKRSLISYEENPTENREGLLQTTLSDFTPDERLEMDDLLETIASNYDAMNESFKTSIDMRLEGLSYEAISQSEGVAVTTIRSRVHRGNERLKRGV